MKRVIEKIAGKKINQLLQEELIEPLNLKHFYYQTHPYAIAHKSNGHFDGYPGSKDFPNEPSVYQGYTGFLLSDEAEKFLIDADKLKKKF